MTTSSDFAPVHRLDRLGGGLAGARCDAAVLVGGGHALHLAGYTRYYSGPVALVVDREGRRTLVVPAYEVEAAAAEADVDAVLPYGGTGFGLDLDPLPKLVDVAARAVTATRLGVASELPGLGQAIAVAAGAEAVAVDGLVHDIRLLKDADEIERIDRSYRLALGGQAEVGRLAVPGAREIELFTAAHAHGQNAAGRRSVRLRHARRGAHQPGVLPGGGRRRRRARRGRGGGLGRLHRRRLLGRHGPHVHRRLEPGGRGGARGITAVLEGVAPRLRPGTVCSELFEAVRAEIAERFDGGAFRTTWATASG